jgi:U3 small nucleolar ribonucleoprotein protein LCP5
MDVSEASSFAAAIKNATEGLSSTRELLKTILDRYVHGFPGLWPYLDVHRKESSPNEFDTRDGISLLSLKHHLMLSYLQAATLLVAHRGLGRPLNDRSPPNVPFASSSRSARGDHAGDMVDHMVEGRLVLEKVKVLEGRMKYQIEKLVRMATEKQTNQNSINGEDQIIPSLLHDSLSFPAHRSTVIPTQPTKSRRSPRQV